MGTNAKFEEVCDLIDGLEAQSNYIFNYETPEEMPVPDTLSWSGEGVEEKLSIFGFTRLHLAENADETRSLIEQGADVNSKALWNATTPLHCAKTFEQTKVLVEAGGDVSAREIDGDKLPIHHAQTPEQTLFLAQVMQERDIPIPDDLRPEQQAIMRMDKFKRADINAAAARALKSLEAGSQAPEQPSMRQRRRC